MEFTTELISALVVSGLSLIGTLTAFLLSFIKAKQAKYDLEKTKVEYETKIYEGSYTICPNCGEKIKLSDMKFHIDK